MTISLLLMTNVSHELAEFSLYKSMQAHKFDQVVIASDRNLRVGREYLHIPLNEKFDRSAYSSFCMKYMDDYIETDHVMIVQPDGMAINPQFWTDEFLQYDYIGAPFNSAEKMMQLALVRDFGQEQYRNHSQWFVGNGGFSMRSKKLLKALKDPRISEDHTNPNTGISWYGEDIQISVINKKILEEEHGIKFAPVDLALQFSTERLCDDGCSFGFHGWQNIPWFLTEEECIYYLNNMSPNYDNYRLNRLAGFFFEKQYYNGMMRLNELRGEWSKL